MANTRKGYIVEAYMPDKDGIERWLPLRNFGERQGDAMDFCRIDCPIFSPDLMRGLANSYRPEHRYARIANLEQSVRARLYRFGNKGESEDEARRREAENLKELYLSNGLETV
ncbi:MAG: hypothetical protein IJL91_05515 [Bacteroidales bacterium]|nr:hypothetical protein [Bacteroidales bacterium]